MSAKNTYSVHLIADFQSCRLIDEPKELKKLLLEAAKRAKNTALKTCIHKFPVQGITGMLLLAESHIAIHTWPEHDYVAIDIFTCGKKTQPYKALEYLKTKFKPRKINVRLLKRGIA